ncbi:hypothetical protein HP548_29495 [Paenibacillus taichungensis]|uniref:DUF4183 domain-containing protein n=1 Tax=Paenibacillus taichungensis TaxID=484184 RepID=A0ABX2MVW8_9BACL|nr:hypothetical protein [Paenibacillus taichungensis]NUU58226.1 hypothetical protein [Paenibacillus taichungensis]
MAAVAKRLVKSNAIPTTSTVLYTVPNGVTTMVKALTVCNSNSIVVNLTLLFAGTYVISNYPIKPSETITLPFMDQVLLSGEAISGLATAGALNCYISGKEVT